MTWTHADANDRREWFAENGDAIAEKYEAAKIALLALASEVAKREATERRVRADQLFGQYMDGVDSLFAEEVQSWLGV